MKKGINLENNEAPVILTRAQRRQTERARNKLMAPPKYGPVTIYRQSFEKVEEEGQKGVKYKKVYQERTNIKQ
jgi:hypothetical protein